MTSLTPFPNDSTLDNPIQKSIADLWVKIEKKQTRNQKFIDKKALFFTEFQTRILPLEQQHGKQLAELVKFLIPFVARKSLTEYQREELLYWIESKIEYLRSHPFVGDVDQNALQEKLNAAVRDLLQSQGMGSEEQKIEQVRDDIEEMFDGELQLTEEEIIALVKDPSLLKQYVQQMQDEYDEKNGTEQDTHQTFEDDFFNNQENARQHAHQDIRQKGLDKLFKAGQLNKIYKRLASVLHPDKELDPLKKEQKHKIMQQLSEARQNKDAYTLLQLYQTHINDGEFQFDSNTLSSIQALLRDKLHRLDDDLQLEKTNNDMSSLVWRKFSGNSKKRTEENFQDHIAALEYDYCEQDMLMQENNTVAKMKKLLQERVEENREWGDPMSFDLKNLMDLF